MAFIDNSIKTAWMLISKQADRLAEQIKYLAQTDDAEPLHQTRVACRRLRELLVFFADYFEPAYMQDWKKTTKKLLTRLGLPRDLDVQIAFLQQFLDELDEKNRKLRPGIERLLLRRRQQRQALQSRVVAAGKRFSKKHILTNLRLQMDKTQYLSEICPPARDTESASSLLARQLSPRIDNVRKRLGCLDNPQDAAGHHKLRIAIKKLRYTVEIGDTMLDGCLKEYLDAFKEAQTILGELHDCDVWLSAIDEFKKEEKQRMTDYAGHARAFGRLCPGLDFLGQDRIANRQTCYHQAVSLITHWRETQLLERLCQATAPQQPLGTQDEPAKTI